MTRATARRHLEDHIEKMIALLDQLDGDADLEDDGSSEPSLNYGMAQTANGLLFLCIDLEDPQCAPARPQKSPRPRAA